MCLLETHPVAKKSYNILVRSCCHQELLIILVFHDDLPIIHKHVISLNLFVFHCSPTFVIGYVMETYGLSYYDAFILVQRKRFCVNPSEFMKRQLLVS